MNGVVCQPEKSATVAAGFVVPNSTSLSYVKGALFSVAYSSAYLQSWEVAPQGGEYSEIRHPVDFGWRAEMAFFTNPVAGHRFGLTGLMRSSLFSWQHGTLGMELDLGLAAYTKPYSRTKDKNNVFIGSSLNCLIHAGINYRTTLSEKLDAMLSAKLVHCSCGYLQKPNQGLNYLQCEMSFIPKQERQVNHRRSVVDTSAGAEWLVSYGQGLVMPRYTGASADYFYAYTARFGSQWRFSPARAAGANIDITYNCSHDALRKFNKDTYKLPFYVGLCANYEAYFNRLSLHLGLAAYLLRSKYGTTPIYERVGVFYNFTNADGNAQFVGVSLKSHYAHIDFIEWHYGVKIRMNKKA